MLTLHTKLAGATRIDARLILPYDARVKCRLRTALSDGEPVAVYTPRGSVLRDGDLLSGDDGRIVQVVAEDEAVLTVRCADPLALLRCAFHLGNRHCQVQLGAGWLRLRDDPVLREMLRGLGAEVSAGMAPFEPEAGAYGGGHHHHDHLLAPVPLRQKIHRPGEPA